MIRLKNEKKGKTMFAEADTLREEILTCPGMKTSISQSSILAGIGARVPEPDFAQELRGGKEDVPDIYLTLPVDL